MKLITYIFSILLLSTHAFADVGGFEFSCTQTPGQKNDQFVTAMLYTQKDQIVLEFEDAGTPGVGDYYLFSDAKSLGARSQFSGIAEYNKSSNQEVTVINATVTVDNAFLTNIYASGTMTIALEGYSPVNYTCSSLAGD